MGVFHAPKSVFINLTIPLLLLLFFVASSEAGFLDSLTTAWNNIFNWYPLTRTLQLISYMKGGPLHVVCTMHGKVMVEGDFKPGSPFNYKFQEWNNKRNYLKCRLWQRGKDIGWFYPFYYGMSSCENTAPHIGKKDTYICKKKIFSTHVEGGKGYHEDTEMFYYQH